MAARRVVVYEFIASGGWSDVYGSPPPASLAAEGRAMLGALAADFAKAGCRTIALVDGAANSDSRFQISDSKAQISSDRSGHGLPSQANLEVQTVPPGAERASLEAAARDADWTVVIAPEFEGLLALRCAWVRGAGRLLGSTAEAIELAADKASLGERWAFAGVPTPPGVLIRAGERLPTTGEFPYPAVCKPRWGAGSQEMALVRGDEAPDHPVWRPAAGDRRLESYCPGVAASVAFLCGPHGMTALPPCRQRLAQDGSFAYLGGETPLPAPWAQRAIRLGRKALEEAGAHGWLGYVGVDLVLGDDPSGCDDVAIEINPRLTTSYVGLRAAVDENLAAAMLAVAEGHDQAPLQAARAIAFSAHGVQP